MGFMLSESSSKSVFTNRMKLNLIVILPIIARTVLNESVSIP